MLTSLFSLFYVNGEFHRFLHRGKAQISRYGWMQPTHMRSVTFLGKFISGSRISASGSDLLKLL